MKRSLPYVLFLFLASPFVHAMDIVPRIGVDAAYQQYVYLDNIDNAVTSDFGLGVNGGVTLVTNRFFIDVGVETANTNTMVNAGNVYTKGWRTERSITIGYRFAQKIWLTLGDQNLLYGSSVGAEDRGIMQSPTFGFSLTNMEQEDFLFTVGFMWMPSITSDGISGVSSPNGSAGGLRLAWRKKGSPHLWSWKYRSYTPDIYSASDRVTKFSYSYLFL